MIRIGYLCASAEKVIHTDSVFRIDFIAMISEQEKPDIRNTGIGIRQEKKHENSEYRPECYHFMMQKHFGEGDSPCHHKRDCDFPVGAKDPERSELKELAAVLNALRSARNAKCVYLCKTWAGTRNKTEETVSIEALDLPAFLADMKLNCLYRIDLSPAAA